MHLMTTSLKIPEQFSDSNSIITKVHFIHILFVLHSATSTYKKKSKIIMHKPFEQTDWFIQPWEPVSMPRWPLQKTCASLGKRAGEAESRTFCNYIRRCGVLPFSSSHRVVWNPSQDDVTLHSTLLSIPLPQKGGKFITTSHMIRCHNKCWMSECIFTWMEMNTRHGSVMWCSRELATKYRRQFWLLTSNVVYWICLMLYCISRISVISCSALGIALCQNEIK